MFPALVKGLNHSALSSASDPPGIDTTPRTCYCILLPLRPLRLPLRNLLLPPLLRRRGRIQRCKALLCCCHLVPAQNHIAPFTPPRCATNPDTPDTATGRCSPHGKFSELLLECAGSPAVR
jgi:hypothetical protein